MYLPLSKAWEVCYYASKVTDKYLEVNGPLLCKLPSHADLPGSDITKPNL